MKNSTFVSVGLLTILLAACNLDKLINDTEPPEVSSIYCNAQNFVVNPGDTVLFWVQASDPQDKELTYLWTLNVGEIIGSAQRDSLRWRAPLKGGKFQVGVKVSNSEKSVSKAEQVTVISLIRPYVKIIKPADSDYLVQQVATTITAEAYHDNGINQVNLLINDSLVSTQGGSASGNYQFNWDTRAPVGQTEIKISAVSNITPMTGADSIRVTLEGIIIGKKTESR